MLVHGNLYSKNLVENRPKSDSISFIFMINKEKFWNMKLQKKDSKVLILNKTGVITDVCSLKEVHTKYTLIAYLNFHGIFLTRLIQNFRKFVVIIYLVLKIENFGRMETGTLLKTDLVSILFLDLGMD